VQCASRPPSRNKPPNWRSASDLTVPIFVRSNRWPEGSCGVDFLLDDFVLLGKGKYHSCSVVLVVQVLVSTCRSRLSGEAGGCKLKTLILWCVAHRARDFRYLCKEDMFCSVLPVLLPETNHQTEDLPPPGPGGELRRLACDVKYTTPTSATSGTRPGGSL
jgi:hypothetical protein